MANASAIGVRKDGNTKPFSFGGNTHSWSNMLSGQNVQVDSNKVLQYYEPKIVNNVRIVVVSSESMVRENKNWSSLILLYVIGPRPYYIYFKAFSKWIWKLEGEFDTI